MGVYGKLKKHKQTLLKPTKTGLGAFLGSYGLSWGASGSSWGHLGLFWGGKLNKHTKT